MLLRYFCLHQRRPYLALVHLLSVLMCWVPAPGGCEDAVQLNQDVRRILSDNCFKCHGPDPAERKGTKGGLRLDLREGATEDREGHPAIVPGKPEKSELVRRITTSDLDDKMPPPESGKKLEPHEIAMLAKW